MIDDDVFAFRSTIGPSVEIPVTRLLPYTDRGRRSTTNGGSRRGVFSSRRTGFFFLV